MSMNAKRWKREARAEALRAFDALGDMPSDLDELLQFFRRLDLCGSLETRTLFKLLNSGKRGVKTKKRCTPYTQKMQRVSALLRKICASEFTSGDLLFPRSLMFAASVTALSFE